MNIMRTLALLGLAILFRVSPLCYWLRQRFFWWHMRIWTALISTTTEALCR
jgi:hypothetical protein